MNPTKILFLQGPKVNRGNFDWPAAWIGQIPETPVELSYLGGVTFPPKLWESSEKN